MTDLTNEMTTNTMTQYVLAQYIEDVFVGDTVAVYGGLAEAVEELERYEEVEMPVQMVCRELQVWEVTAKHIPTKPKPIGEKV